MSLFTEYQQIKRRRAYERKRKMRDKRLFGARHIIKERWKQRALQPSKKKDDINMLTIIHEELGERDVDRLLASRYPLEILIPLYNTFYTFNTGNIIWCVPYALIDEKNDKEFFENPENAIMKWLEEEEIEMRADGYGTIFVWKRQSQTHVFSEVDENLLFSSYRDDPFDSSHAYEHIIESSFKRLELEY